MNVAPAVRAAVEAATGRVVTGATAVGGGDVADAHRLDLAGGARVFLKTSAHAPAGSFAAEARGLAWLAEARAIRVPEVLAVSEEAGPDGFSPMSIPAASSYTGPATNTAWFRPACIERQKRWTGLSRRTALPPQQVKA